MLEIEYSEQNKANFHIITLIVGAIASAIIIGLLGAFVTLAVISFAKILCCLINKKYKYKEPKNICE